MTSDLPFEDDRWRPSWEAGPDETDVDQWPKSAARGREQAPKLTLLAVAQDAVSRLDALLGAAPRPIRDGVVVRIAYREAAGWLAFKAAWVHPLDLALRAAGVLGPFAGAGKGAPWRVMPHTFAAHATEPWEAMDGIAMLDADDAVSQALTMIGGGPTLTGVDDFLQDGRALLVTRSPPPFWAAHSALGNGVALDGWPRLRSDVARRVGADDWPGHFLHLTAESCLMGLRDLTALQTVHQRPAAHRRRSSRRPDALDCLIELMLVTPKDLATRLGITLQAALGLLRTLQGERVVHEITGRESYRAFSLNLP